MTSLDYSSPNQAQLPIHPFKGEARTALFKDPVRTAQ